MIKVKERERERERVKDEAPDAARGSRWQFVHNKAFGDGGNLANF